MQTLVGSGPRGAQRGEEESPPRHIGRSPSPLWTQRYALESAQSAGSRAAMWMRYPGSFYPNMTPQEAKLILGVPVVSLPLMLNPIFRLLQ
jgi:hypothetical protein